MSATQEASFGETSEAVAAKNFVADDSPQNAFGERRFVQRLSWFGPVNLFMILGSTIPTAAIATLFSLLFTVHLDEKSANAAIGLTNVAGVLAGAIFSVIVGNASDRTRSRWGRRNPWIVFGAVLATAGIIGLSFVPVAQVWPVILCFVVFQAGLNSMLAAYRALLPDRVGSRLMGRASAYAGFGSLGGTALGAIVANVLIKSLGVANAESAYRFLPWLMIIIVVVALPGADLRNQPLANESRGLIESIREFRLPKDRDYWLAYAGRFFTVVGLMLTLQTQSQILVYYVKLTPVQAAGLGALGGLALAGCGAIASIIAGPLSDKLGRRKVLVAGSAILAGVAPLVLMMAPSNPTLFYLISTGIGAIAFCFFSAIDQALMVEVLPNPETAARDLGFLGTTNTLSGVLAGALGALIIGSVGFVALFVSAVVCCVAGALIFIPIRRVR